MSAVARMLARSLAATAAAIGLALVPTSASAADGSITHVEPSPGSLQVLVSVPADAAVDLAGVTAAVDGKTAVAVAEPASQSKVRRTTVLAIDTSDSMAGRRFKAAKLAARTFISTAPDDVYIAIVTFAADVTTNFSPSLDRTAALEVVAGLELTRETRLYDGVIQAVEVAGTEGQRSLLVLSDGADTSETPIGDATSAISDAEVLADVVALEQSGEALEFLQQLATAGQGQLISSDPAALEAAFAAAADALAQQVVVTATLPRGFDATQATVEVSLPTSAGQVSVEAFTAVQPLPPTLSSPTSWTPPTWSLYAGPGALGLGLVLMVVLLAPRRKILTAGDRVTQYTDTQASSTTPSGSFDSDVTFASAKKTAASMLRRNEDLDARISARLQGAGSQLKSSEWLLLHGAIFFVSGLMGLVLGGGSLVFGFIFLVLGLVGPWLYLGFKRSRRRKAFNSGLPDTLQLMSGSLAAGLSLGQSVDTIVREGSEPIASEFRRVLVETRLGVSLEDALEGVAGRFASKDFEWVVMAIKIQREVGGNLAELLDKVAATMREREYVRRQVAALAAEGKLSAWVLGGLPPLFMVYLLLTNYNYVIVMFQEPVGWLMLGGAVTILSVGVFWMSRLVKVEV